MANKMISISELEESIKDIMIKNGMLNSDGSAKYDIVLLGYDENGVPCYDLELIENKETDL